MSEYQFYEFQAIDRDLTDKEMTELRAFSTRADITSNSFVIGVRPADLQNACTALSKKDFRLSIVSGYICTFFYKVLQIPW